MMSSKKKAILLGLFSLFAMFIISSVCAGDSDSSKILKQRPSVLLNHGTHMGMGSEGCLECHHVYDKEKNNILDEAELNEMEAEEYITLDVNLQKDASAYKCASCHNNKDVTKIKSREAFHRQCIGCHEKEASGPVLCGECHKRSKKNASGE